MPSPQFKQPASLSSVSRPFQVPPPRGVAVKKVTAYRHPPPSRSDGSVSFQTSNLICQVFFHVTHSKLIFIFKLLSQSQEIVAIEQQYSCLPETPLPPIGQLMRPKPRANDVVYVMKMSFFGVWLKGRVMEVMNTTADGKPVSVNQNDASAPFCCL